jgi:hypothetical protein
MVIYKNQKKHVHSRSTAISGICPDKCKKSFLVQVESSKTSRNNGAVDTLRLQACFKQICHVPSESRLPPAHPPATFMIASILDVLKMALSSL